MYLILNVSLVPRDISFHQTDLVCVVQDGILVCPNVSLVFLDPKICRTEIFINDIW